MKNPKSKASYVFDAISPDGSLETPLRFLDASHDIVSAALLPFLFARIKKKRKFKYAAGITAYNSASSGFIQPRRTLDTYGHVTWKSFCRSEELKPHPYEDIPGGLGGVLTGLQMLRDGKATAVKYVYRIEGTKNTKSRISSTSSVRTHPGPSSHPYRTSSIRRNFKPLTMLC